MFGEMLYAFDHLAKFIFSNIHIQNSSYLHPRMRTIELLRAKKSFTDSAKYRWRRMVQSYVHDSVMHTNVLRFNHTCQLTVLNFS